METVTLTIDGRAIAVEKGKTVLQAALENGISIPYYCYHPGIGIDGSCRVCIVKVEKMPKLQTSCSMSCADGMVVHTRSEDVVAARAGVFEFLLVNHPLDCPVCDKGGECPLQDFSYTFGPEQSRMDFARRTFDGDGVRADVDFGPTLMLNRNRCIMCTRCVRFMRDIDGDAQINIIDRGYASEIATFREEGVHSLLSGNLADVCPVGAITTRSYRFQSRPWDNPNAADTICTQCSRGCNTTAWIKAKPEWAKGSQLIRFTPRFNPDVNGYWMCDIGRFDFHWIEGESRLRHPLVRDKAGARNPVSWQELATALSDRLTGKAVGGARFLLSAHASHEELFLFTRLAAGLQSISGAPTMDRGDSESDAPPISVSWRVRPKPQPANTKFHVPAVDAPNVKGAQLFGLAAAGADVMPDVSALRAAVGAGQVDTLYVFDPGPDGSIGDVSWVVEARRNGKLPLLIVQGILLTELAQEADFLLPGASFVEKEASYSNEQGRLQGTGWVIPPPGEATDDWQIVVNLSTTFGFTLDYATAAQIRAEIITRFPDVREFADLATLTFGQPVPGRHWLQASNPSERWKWDFMFRDLPPVKGSVDPSALPPSPGVIPLKVVK